jgi:hypothetical protein
MLLSGRLGVARWIVRSYGRCDARRCLARAVRRRDRRSHPPGPGAARRRPCGGIRPSSVCARRLPQPGRSPGALERPPLRARDQRQHSAAAPEHGRAIRRAGPGGAPAALTRARQPAGAAGTSAFGLSSAGGGDRLGRKSGRQRRGSLGAGWARLMGLAPGASRRGVPRPEQRVADDDRFGDVDDDGRVAVPGLAAQLCERFVGCDSVPLHQDALCLFDQGATPERSMDAAEVGVAA